MVYWSVGKTSLRYRCQMTFSVLCLPHHLSQFFVLLFYYLAFLTFSNTLNFPVCDILLCIPHPLSTFVTRDPFRYTFLSHVHLVTSNVIGCFLLPNRICVETIILIGCFVRINLYAPTSIKSCFFDYITMN